MKRILLLCILFIATVVGATYYYSIQVNGSFIYHVKSGANIISIAHQLRSQGIIKSSDLFIYAARLKNIQPQTGYYRITTIEQFLDDIHMGNTLKDTITLLPGKTSKQYYEQLKSTQSVTLHREFTDIMQELNIPKPYEGRFLADTYHINYGDSALSIFKRSHALYTKTLAQVWQQRNKHINITTPYELTILASMIEKESGNEGEKSTIAGVFTNRLAKNMRLQSDPTTIYALKQLKVYDGNLTKENLKTKSPYNTYTITGLPIGAISNVAKSTLIAASKPAQHNYYYFVAKDKHTHIFATTYAQHKKNIKTYITSNHNTSQ